MDDLMKKDPHCAKAAYQACYAGLLLVDSNILYPFRFHGISEIIMIYWS